MLYGAAIYRESILLRSLVWIIIPIREGKQVVTNVSHAQTFALVSIIKIMLEWLCETYQACRTTQHKWPIAHRHCDIRVDVICLTRARDYSSRNIHQDDTINISFKSSAKRIAPCKQFNSIQTISHYSHMTNRYRSHRQWNIMIHSSILRVFS